jgi:formylglycine-generating enzyme required for sulfatase activity
MPVPEEKTVRIVWEKDGKEMIYIPGGTFLMGSDEGSDNQRPAHEVYVAPFYIDRYPVTNEEYKRFLDETGHPIPNYNVSWTDCRNYNWDTEKRTYPEGKGRHPAVLVTWEDALAYASWADKRLPTEAEWEGPLEALTGGVGPGETSLLKGVAISRRQASAVRRQ